MGLFNNKSIIYIQRGKIKAGKVSPGKPANPKKLREYSWTAKDLINVFRRIRKELKMKKVRILLADDLSYVLKLEIPGNLEKEDEREAIAMRITDQIPEILENPDWDFKELKKEKDQEEKNSKSIIVFAPVKKFFENLSMAVAKSKMEVEAIEPVIVAGCRHQDPMSGLAMKEDLKGKDEEILNILPLPPLTIKERIIKLKKEAAEKNKKDGQPGENEGDKEPVVEKKPVINKKLLVFAILVIISSIVAIAVILYSRSQKKKTPAKKAVVTTSIATPSATPTQTASPSATPELEESTGSAEATAAAEINMADYSFQILNGSGTVGESDRLKEFLEKEGFEKFETGNANAYDYTETEVSLKEGIPDKVFEAIEKALKNEYNLLKKENLTADFRYDIVIIVGQRKS